MSSGFFAANKLYDCVVVGAGIEGSSTAYHLAKQGRDTLLLEQFPIGHSRGSSGGHSRITRYAYDETEFAQMMPECFKLWVELENETNTKLYRKLGLVVIDNSPYTNIGKMQRALESINHSYTKLTASEICSRYPGVWAPAKSQGIIEHGGGILLASKCLTALQTQFVKYGGVLRDCEQVQKILPGTTVIVETNKGSYRCKSIVLAPGPWASKLLRPLGLDPPLKPWRLDVCYWKEKTPGLFDDYPVNIIWGDNCHAYALPSEEYPGLVKVCDHMEHEICNPDERDIMTPERHRLMQKLQAFVRQYFPGLVDKPAIVESCMYTVTPDEKFYLDTHPEYHNIVIGCGFSGHGFKLAPVVGKVLSELAMQTATSYDLSPFRLDRFPNGPQARL